MSAYTELLQKTIGELELAARLKEVEHKAALAAARADGIEAARRAVAAVVDETKDIVGLVVADQVLAAIDTLTEDAPEGEK